MTRTRTKICGITSPEDALMCSGLGADFLGVIFAESGRKVTVSRACEIRKAVPRAALVGVFSDPTVDAVRLAADHCGLNLIQLHGSESPELVESLALGVGLPVIKSFTAAAGLARGPGLLKSYGAARFFLFDLDKGAPDENTRMGALWEEAAAAVAEGHGVFLAGGLTAENVGAAVARVRPYCVDVCRAVEAAPGVKDRGAVGRFIAEVRSDPA